MCEVIAETPADDERRIGDYIMLGVIGRGSFAEVRLAWHVPTATEVAVKIVATKGHSYFKEVRCLKNLNHPNIVRLYEVITTEHRAYLFLEYLGGGELLRYLEERGPVCEKGAQALFRQLLSAVEYCHRKGIVHLDLKPDNILIDEDLNIKVSDFGFSEQYSEAKLTTFCGTVPYMAPEILKLQPYEGPKADVWSMGVILYRILTGELPFVGKSFEEQKRNIISGVFFVPSFLSPESKTLLGKLLTLEPSQRPALAQVMDDYWVNVGEEELRPYSEPPWGEVDPQVALIMDTLGHDLREVQDAVTRKTCDRIMATYIILASRKSARKGRTIRARPCPSSRSSGSVSSTQGIQGSGQTGRDPASATPSLESRVPSETSLLHSRMGTASSRLESRVPPAHSRLESRVPSPPCILDSRAPRPPSSLGCRGPAPRSSLEAGTPVFPTSMLSKLTSHMASMLARAVIPPASMRARATIHPAPEQGSGTSHPSSMQGRAPIDPARVRARATIWPASEQGRAPIDPARTGARATIQPASEQGRAPPIDPARVRARATIRPASKQGRPPIDPARTGARATIQPASEQGWATTHPARMSARATIHPAPEQGTRTSHTSSMRARATTYPGSMEARANTPPALLEPRVTTPPGGVESGAMGPQPRVDSNTTTPGPAPQHGTGGALAAQPEDGKSPSSSGHRQRRHRVGRSILNFFQKLICCVPFAKEEHWKRTKVKPA
ncbi:PREDICTED: serine/threonine-protein kinase MARK2-like [Miniopterus natalensis]|uniref:serine/threonine-protein kinase MARK2-like n=1 Tax=Miniopterus natalensis TaxID=291302 RepID=UPI0007A6F47C|nr:PREDICTED: serine/threonine-protein kinase MARK2-like [Miniopterus natalensis]